MTWRKWWGLGVAICFLGAWMEDHTHSHWWGTLVLLGVAVSIIPGWKDKKAEEQREKEETVSEEQKDARIAELEEAMQQIIADSNTGEMSTAQVASRAYTRAVKLMKPEVGREWPPAKAGS